LKSGNGRNAAEKPALGKGNGRKQNGFAKAMPLFERDSWGVTFPGPGEPMPGPGMYEKPALTEDEGREGHCEKAPAPAGCAPKADKSGKGPADERPFTANGFFELVDGALVATQERYAW
jgi:hypothetical protein